MPDDANWDRNANLPGYRSVIDPADTSGIKNALIDRAQRSVLAEVLARPSSARVLDLGCGTGRLTDRLGTRGARPIGVDGSVEMLGQARARGTWAPLVCADALALPFPGATFDAVLSVGVIAVLAADPGVLRGVLAEAARVLTPGGRLIAIEQAADEDFGRGAALADYREAMEAVGLQVGRTEPVRLGDSAVIARCLRHPWMARLPGVVSRIRSEARAASGPFTGGRYVDELIVATKEA